jgi:hypothetical protein
MDEQLKLSVNKYRTTFDAIDENLNPIQINLILSRTAHNKCTAEIFDSSRRYFYAPTLGKDFDYYYKLSVLNKFDNIRYCYRLDGTKNMMMIYLEGGKWDDVKGLEEIAHSKLHVKNQLINIINLEKQVDEIKRNIKNAMVLYPTKANNEYTKIYTEMEEELEEKTTIPEEKETTIEERIASKINTEIIIPLISKIHVQTGEIQGLKNSVLQIIIVVFLLLGVIYICYTDLKIYRNTLNVCNNNFE